MKNIRKLIRKTLEGAGYHVYAREQLPYGFDHALDIRRFSRGLHPVKCVLDVGANIGQTARAYHEAFPDAAIHSFEPVRSTYLQLLRETQDCPEIHAYHHGMGGSDGEQEIELMTSPLLNSLARPMPQHATGERETVRIRTVDGFCSEAGIDLVDLLKTDTEGYDLEVLRGAENMLSSGRIRYVFSEVGFLKQDSHHTCFHAVADFLRRHDFDFVSVYDQDFNSFNPPRPPLSYANALFYRAV
jgi:FkbM family methyltransferase